MRASLELVAEIVFVLIVGGQGFHHLVKGACAFAHLYHAHKIRREYTLVGKGLMEPDTRLDVVAYPGKVVSEIFIVLRHQMHGISHRDAGFECHREPVAEPCQLGRRRIFGGASASNHVSRLVLKSFPVVVAVVNEFRNFG